jgi:hypothetical protein
MRTLGIEPANIAKIARQENGIETMLAKGIAREYGKAKVVTANL